MRTTERLTKFKDWITTELCVGREMKAPAANMDITKIVLQEPKCYLAYMPKRPDSTGLFLDDAVNTCPSILVLLNAAHVKYMEEKRFDRYNKVFRPGALGQILSVNLLFSVYEPGMRLPGFVESAGEHGAGTKLDLITEGTEQGLFTLLNWMDDCKEKLLGIKSIPHTDMFINEDSMYYSLYTDQSYVVDKRPIYYGFVSLDFNCYADEGLNPKVEDYLR